MSAALEISARAVRDRIAAGEKLYLIDVREPHEHQICHIDGAELIPMNTIPPRLQEIEAKADAAPLIFFCHHGMRSLNVVNWLRGQGVEDCQSMSGGIDAWSVEIDSAVPRY
jgi:rhodanese-related sulfurtransferase